MEKQKCEMECLNEKRKKNSVVQEKKEFNPFSNEKKKTRQKNAVKFGMRICNMRSL
jgi:hypothetical protein